MVLGSLFDFASETDEFLWVKEALADGLLKPGQMLDVVKITTPRSGKGYLLQCELPDGTEVYDFAYMKSKPGKTFTQMFADPTLADGVQIQVKTQDSSSNAVCGAREVEGLEWHLGQDLDRPTLTPVKKQKKPGKTDEGKQ